jgi:ATP-dependent DNA helicase RecG
MNENSAGGYIIIGIDDKNQLIGTKIDNAKRSAIQGSIGEASPALHFEMYPVKVDDKEVWVIDIPSGNHKTYGGSLPQQYKQAIEWLQSKLQISYLIEGTGPRKEIWEIPLSVFKEAIINSISHRDYYEQGAVTTIEMFDDRVEISNPGGLLSVVAKNFGRKSLTRNPLIFGLFTRMHLVERIASGIPRMKADMKDAGLPEPEFQTEGMFTVTFYRPEKIVSPQMITDIIAGIKHANKILVLISENSKITAVMIGKELSLSENHVRKILANLLKNNIIDRIGSRKDGEWIFLIG